MHVGKTGRQEFNVDGVRCNAICPGGIDTPMNVGLRMPEDMDFNHIRKMITNIDATAETRAW